MPRAVAAACLATTLVVLLHGCLDVAELETPTADAGPDADTGSPDVVPVPIEILGAVPPERPAGVPAPSGKGALRWFAARRIFAGTVDTQTGKSSPTGWTKIGHDVDGECTSPEQSQSNSSATCKRPAGSGADTLVDGDDCRDNAYGRMLATATQTLNSDWESKYQGETYNGRSTLVLRLADLDAGPDDPFVPGAVYLSADTQWTPSWDGNDDVQIQSLTVNGKSIADPPVMAFPKGYLKDHVWVSGERGTSVGPYPILVIEEVLLSSVQGTLLVAKLDAKHERILGSTMSGVAERAKIVSEWSPYLMDAFGCVPALIDLLEDKLLLPAMDIAPGPTFVSPADDCDCLSIGSSYEWMPIRAPTAVVEVKPPFASCDGGT